MDRIVQAAFLDEAEPSAISHAVRDVLERHGALITEHVSSRVRFHSLTDGSTWSWNRAGYVGIYQRFGEKEVEVRLDLKARWPHRMLWIVATINVVLWIGALLLQPAGTTWFVLAFLGGMALIIAGLVYLNTWRGVRDLERQLMVEFEAEFKKDHVGHELLTQEARALAEAEAALEGEVERVRVAKARKEQPKPVKEKREKPPKLAGAAGKLRLSLRRKRDEEAPATDETPAEDDDAKRARLEALRVELRRKRDERGP